MLNNLSKEQQKELLDYGLEKGFEELIKEVERRKLVKKCNSCARMAVKAWLLTNINILNESK